MKPRSTSKTKARSKTKLRRAREVPTGSRDDATETMRARLAEAEETLQAIREGHVDALVVYPDEGPEKVFTLQGADHTYRRLVETMREGAATLSAQGVILYGNAHLAELLGVPLERMMGSTLREHVNENALGRFDAILAEGGKRSCAGEVELDTHRGPISTYVSATPSADAHPVAMCVVVTDLTEQKRNEEIVAAERLAASILDQAAEAIVVCDPAGVIVRASRAAHRLCGCNPLQRRFEDVMPLRGSTDARALIERAVHGDVVHGLEADLPRPDGSHVSLLVAAGPLLNERRQTLGTVVALTDVTSRIEAEKRYRFLADSMPQIVWAAKPDGVVDYFNQRWNEYTGRVGDRRHHDEQVVHVDDHKSCVEQWERSVATGDPYEVSYRLRRHDGVYRWHLGRALAQKTESGRVIRWFGTCTDIDDQKRAEAQAEEANHLKDEFLATVSHELRTPLTSILGWARLLRSTTIDQPTRDKGLDTLERSAKAQAQLIEDLLDVSRITSGKLRLDVQPQKLDEVVLAAIDAAKPTAAAKGVELRVVLDESGGLVMGDSVRLQQIAWNLLTNAIKFTAKGGHVQVVVTRVDSTLELSVSDDGAGIAPEFLPFVFERFRQADSSITRSRAGLGLGLSIVRHLTELHGGTVDVRSEGLGKGATFFVRLPVAVGSWRAATSGSAAVDPNPNGRKREVDLSGVHVLVVDDEPDARELLAFVLTQHGARVVTASSARDALETLKHEPPNVLVSDIGMPVEDGYTLIQNVRALAPHASGNVPAIALTAYTRAEDRLRALRAGFQMHLGKPIEPLELVLVVAGLARRTLGASPAPRVIA